MVDTLSKERQDKMRKAKFEEKSEEKAPKKLTLSRETLAKVVAAEEVPTGSASGRSCFAPCQPPPPV